MTSRFAGQFAVPVLTVAIVATVCVGATYASTTSHGAKACETSKGYLLLASPKGRCPKHTSKVTLGRAGPLGKRGPQGTKGPTGPSAAYVAADEGGFQGGTTEQAFASLPTGSYVFTATFDGFNDTANSEAAGCTLDLHGHASTQVAFLEVPPEIEGGGSVSGRAATSLVVGAVINDTTGHDVSVDCADSDLFFTWSVSAQLVGSLTSLGQNGFG